MKNITNLNFSCWLHYKFCNVSFLLKKDSNYSQEKFQKSQKSLAWLLKFFPIRSSAFFFWCFYLPFRLPFHVLTCTEGFLRMNLRPFLENITHFKIFLYLVQAISANWDSLSSPFPGVKSIYILQFQFKCPILCEFPCPACKKLVILSTVLPWPWHKHFYCSTWHHLT